MCAASMRFDKKKDTLFPNLLSEQGVFCFIVALYAFRFLNNCSRYYRLELLYAKDFR